MTWYAGAHRTARLSNALEVNEFDALLALTPENAAYLAGESNYISTHWRVPGLYSAVVGRSSERAVVSPDFGSDAQHYKSWCHFPFRLWTESIDVRGVPGAGIADRIVAARPVTLDRPAQFEIDEVFDQVANAVKSSTRAPNRIGADLASVSTSTLSGLSSRLPGIELIEATTVFDDLRALKDSDEIEKLRIAGELTEIGIAGAVAKLQSGMKERAINATYQIAIQERVISDDRFAAFRQAEGVASVGFGADSPRVVGPGQTIKFDMQVDVGGYHSDIGRTYAIEPTKDQTDIYKTLYAGLLVAQEKMRTGVSFSEVYWAGMQTIRDAGFSNYSRGHLGHSVGLAHNFEESPFIAADEHRPLVPGMVISLEMPYYVDGVGAFQLERMLLVTNDGLEPLDKLPFEFAIDL